MSKPASLPASTPSLPVGDERAGVGRGLDRDLVQRGVEVEQRGRGVGVEVVVGVRRRADPGGRACVGGRVGERRRRRSWRRRGVTLWRRFWPVSLTTRRRSAAGLKSTPNVRAGERDGQLADLGGLAPFGRQRVDAARVADAVQLAVLHPEVDADELGVAARGRRPCRQPWACRGGRGRRRPGCRRPPGRWRGRSSACWLAAGVGWSERQDQGGGDGAGHDERAGAVHRELLLVMRCRLSVRWWVRIGLGRR